MAKAKKLINEDGIVLSKEIKEATNEFPGKDGKIVKALPIRYCVTVASSSSVDNVFGMSYMSICEFIVEKALFDKLKYLLKVNATFVFGGGANGDKAEPISLAIKE
ncbi:MAG: hypothetical protein RR140_02490 [Clostridia bacterium]